MDAGALPLHGLRVLDMTDGRGEMCGRYLADLGADVVRIVTPAADGVPGAPADAAAAAYHAGKRAVVIDLAPEAGPAGRAALAELLAGADVWIESSAPGAADGADLDPVDVARRHPALVVASITDFGRTGPYAGWKATDPVLTALTGSLSRSGIAGREPLLPPAGIALETAAAQAAWGIVVAYYQRILTGRGDHLDLGLYELAAQALDPPFGVAGTASPTRAMADTTRGRPLGNNYPVFPCADGHVRLSILAPRQWHAMRAWMGEPEELQDPAFDSLFERAARLAELAPHYNALFATMGKTELAVEGQSRGIPIAPVLTPGEVLESAHFRARGAFTDVDGPGGRPVRIPAGALEVDGVRAAPRRDLPAQPGWVHRADEPTVAPDGAEAGRRPLEGLRVLDLGVIVVGADTARLLADEGADVIKVESAAYPDMTRIDATSFIVGHRGSRSIGLNLRDPAGADLFRKLVAVSDVLLVNFKPGTLEKLGLGPDELHAVNPGLVIVSSSAFGDSGPWSTWMGYGPLVRVGTGITSLWRYPDDPEAVCDGVTIYPDHYAARIGALAGLAGILARRRRGGRGCTITVSQAEVALMHLSAAIARESVQPGTIAASGNIVPGHAPAGLFACAGDDEWCVVDVRDDADWAALQEVLGRPDWAADPALATTAGRVQRRAELDERLAAWTAERSPLEVAETLQAAGIPAGPMFRAFELRDNPHLLARDFFATLEQDGTEPLLVENAPFQSSHLPDPEMRSAPLRGEHTREICRQLLALDDEQIEELLAAGILEDRAEKITL